MNEEASKMVEVAVEAATERKAHGGVVLTVTGLCSYADFILILSAESDRQVQAISERIDQAMRDHEWRPLGTEGVGQGGWALLDYGDLVVHVFRDDLRDFYDLEGLWVDAPRAEIVDGEIVETAPQESLPEEPLEDDPDDG